MLQYDPDTAVTQLRQDDPGLSDLMDRVGAFGLTINHGMTPFHILVRAIVNQQISQRAAQSIYRRLRAALGGTITVPRVLNADTELFRGAGLSKPKIAAVRDLAEKCQQGLVPNLRVLRGLGDLEVVNTLEQVRGIGRWTAEMLLIFHLGRPDVLPVTDLGIRRGFMIAYGGGMPSEKSLLEYGERWRPYRSVASWYLWRANYL